MYILYSVAVERSSKTNIHLCVFQCRDRRVCERRRCIYCTEWLWRDLVN